MSLDRYKTSGVYISVPFCRAKCSFCNFASGVGTPQAMDSYVERLCAEFRAAHAHAASLRAELSQDVDSVYFGGGTPSLLTPGQLKRIFSALRESFAVQNDAEITLEAAPGQIEQGVLEAALRLGVNRVSLGVQSFVDRECTAVGRSHTGDSCLAEFRRLRSSGVASVGADLIAGLPYQTRESWQSSLHSATQAELDHLSIYILEIDEGSRLGREVLGGGARLHAPAVASEDLAAELYEMACERLPAAGFAQYEISNFARAGRQSRHNMKYWRRQPYVGFGLDAHSMLRRADGSAIRFANPDVLTDYGNGSQVDRTEVGVDAALEESMFLGLRMVEGVSVSEMRAEFGPNRLLGVEEAAAELASGGLLTSEHDRWTLTLRGQLLSNEVFTHLLMSVAA